MNENNQKLPFRRDCVRKTDCIIERSGPVEADSMDRAVHIAIVEDSDADCALLEDSLRRFEQERDVRFEVTRFRDGEDLVTDYAADYDLILMDIQMTFMNGMEAAKRVRAMDPDVVICATGSHANIENLLKSN